ncbi:hypothetical protein Mboo_1870 [Methanoregula boonei 6A8]|uniref:Uncharacterized protein n=1 Tax=Methanoregula boonei (strain DSM 21154 / JCM 14090 / 6A8) TaxID=456442 RepID=A7I9H4_METB6|nr:hypothetical protein Mboo_1870 [Methanoregula boonei 6A8]
MDFPFYWLVILAGLPFFVCSYGLYLRMVQYTVIPLFLSVYTPGEFIVTGIFMGEPGRTCRCNRASFLRRVSRYSRSEEYGENLPAGGGEHVRVRVNQRI